MVVTSVALKPEQVAWLDAVRGARTSESVILGP
jgi:hypothetical protein